MTNAQINSEILYHASISPFKRMLAEGIISNEDYRLIDTILRAKYRPIFVADIIAKSLDNQAKQS